MEQATPILESFTESVGDGPSQPLIRKLMSLVLQQQQQQESRRPLTPPMFVTRRGGQQPEEPFDEVENIGFSFGHPSPSPENYFVENRIPIDLMDKVPLELLHAINDDASSSRQGLARFLPSSSSSYHEDEDSVIGRLERLETICSRTEAYLRMAIGNLDRRLQLLEGNQPTSFSTVTRDSASCPMSPLFHGPVPCDVSTLVTPDMLKPGLEVIAGASTTSDACLSPIDVVPSPRVFKFPTPLSLEQHSRMSDACNSPIDFRFSAPVPAEPMAGRTPVQDESLHIRPLETGQHRQESTSDALLSDPVVIWCEGVPYLRPSRRLEMAPHMKDTVVLNWDGQSYIPPPSASEDNDDDDVTTYMSSDDALSEVPKDIGTGEDPSVWEKHNEVISVLEDMFTSLALSIPDQHSQTVAEEDCGLACSRVHESGYVQVPQSDGEAEQGYEVASGTIPKLTLAFSNQGSEMVEQRADMCIKVDLPRPPACTSEDGPVNIHVAVSPKELTQEQASEEELALSIVQDICISVEGPLEGWPECDVVPELPADRREAVAISKDKLHLTEDIVADYTFKAVSKEQEADSSSSRDPNLGVSSVIHELCFGVDVPLAEPAAGLSELPLDVAISLSGNPPGSRANEEPIASVVLSLDAMQKAEPSPSMLSPSSMVTSPSQSSLEAFVEQQVPAENRPLAFNWEGVPVDDECDDIPCLVNRRRREEVPAVKEQVCISVEVPTAETEAPKPCCLQIGIAVKTLTTAGDSALIDEQAGEEKVPFEEMAQQQRDVPPSKDELTPLMAENMCQDACLPQGDIEPLAAPPPSPVEMHVKKHATDSIFDIGIDMGIESVLMVRDLLPPRVAKVPKPVDLICGYDGKSCLLSVSMDDFWGADDMCQSPTSVLTAKSDFEPFCTRSCYDRKTLGFLLEQDESRDKTLLGFFNPTKPSAALENLNLAIDIPTDNAIADCALPPVPSALKQVKKTEQHEPKAKVPDSPGARSCIIDGDLPCAAQQEVPKAKVPDSPGARLCIIDGDVSPKTKGVDKDNPQACIMRGDSLKRTIPDSGRAASKREPLVLLDATLTTTPMPAAGDLHLLPLESPSSRSSSSNSQDEFFDALQCPGGNRHRRSRRLRRFFKDKILSRLACYRYGFSMVDSDFSDVGGGPTCHHERLTI